MPCVLEVNVVDTCVLFISTLKETSFVVWRLRTDMVPDRVKLVLQPLAEPIPEALVCWADIPKKRWQSVHVLHPRAKDGGHLAVEELEFLFQAARAWDPAVPVGSAGPFDGEAYRPAMFSCGANFRFCGNLRSIVQYG